MRSCAAPARLSTVVSLLLLLIGFPAAGRAQATLPATTQPTTPEPAQAAATAQQPSPAMPDFSKDPKWFPQVLAPYRSKKIPPPDFRNQAISGMIQDGKLQLSVAQLTAAVMQNNLDIASARYYRHYAETDVLRAKAGGAPRGSAVVSFPSGLFAGALGAGLITEQSASGASGPAISGRSAGVRGLSPRGNYDPNFNLSASMDRSSTPLNTLRVAGVTNAVTSTATLQTRYNQAFTSGTGFSVGFNVQRTSSNQRFLRFNPSYTPNLSFTVTQRLLNGFGFAANRRFLNVAKNGKEIAREAFRQQVTDTLVQAQNSYWDLVAFRETVVAAEQALRVAQQLYEDNKKRAEVGTLAPLDVVAANSEVAARQRDLTVAQTNAQQAEVQLKNLISKEIDPALAAARIETTDPLPQPTDADIPTLQDAIASAQQNRPELPQREGNILNQKVAEAFSRTALRPFLVVFGQYETSSLYGGAVIADSSGAQIATLPGGWTRAISQLLHSDFPSYVLGLSLTIPIKNRSAQADNLRARLEERQGEADLQRTRNQIALEVRNAVIGLMQAKSQVEAAGKAVEFGKQTVDAEQKKLNAGVSTTYQVILVERDLLSAQLAEVQARASYAKARVEMDRAMGVVLEKNHIDPQGVPKARFRVR